MKQLLISLLIAYKKLQNDIQFQLTREEYTSKVFCIGYNKTGTTTIGKSLEMLGYRNSSFNKKVWRDYYANHDLISILKYTAKFQSFDDLPWLKEDMIPIMDFAFPNSKFIYLVRDELSWKRSLYNWTFKTIGKYPDVEEAWAAFKRHERFVLQYFKDRPSTDFIILNVSDEYGFKKLANFLNKPTDRLSFPKYNAS